ncbi:spore coat protein [Virgibacillus sp. C22-A2]|uniref:Spore coat protein n=1 Tax=Virgibacillus tibetensis TaxID=3042313 RepID=A0ABU6KF71_9BACI|nr:spore coat protein [Virgibacillus sp. C22-A2]
MEPNQQKHLAWHETLEIHELVAFQSVGLMKLKKAIGEIKDSKLRGIYEETIKGLEQNIRELLKFYPMAPREDSEYETRNLDTAFYAGDLLALSKTSVRNYAIAITESATPAVRETLNNHLQKAVRTHGKVFYYMYEKGLYPAYNLDKLLKGDMENARKALEMRY